MKKLLKPTPFVIAGYAQNCQNTPWNNYLAFMSIHKMLTPVMKG